MTVVSNTPPRARVLSTSADERNARGRAPRLVYLGLLEEPRGLRSVLHAVRRLRDQGCDTPLDVIGGGREEPLFHAEAERLGLAAPSVVFHGRLPHERALQFVEAADIGLVPHHLTGNWVSTIPNKLFDYMAAGLPVVASDVPPVRRVLAETRAGELHAPADAEALAAAVARLLDPEARRRAGDAGRHAVRTTYNWEADTVRLLAVMQETVAQHRLGATG
jgi:glycosyltransferase involved in cell wall biosynthesis